MNLLFKSFSQVNYSLGAEEEILEPIIFRQPRIKYSTTSEEQIVETVLENDKIETVTSLELDFTFDYRNYLAHFKPLTKTVTLKRYKKKKKHDEQYVAAKHEPEIVSLPIENDPDEKYILSVSEDIKENTFPCVHTRKVDIVSLKISKPLTGKIKDRLKNICNDFLDYMMFDDATISSEYAFQFFVEITFQKNTNPSAKHSITLSSFVFEYGIDQEPTRVSIVYVDAENYHLGNFSDSVVAKPSSRLSKLAGSLKEKLSIKKKSK